MKEIVLATRNEKKRKELAALLSRPLNARILSINDLVLKVPIIKENGKTFKENAVKKALTVSRFTDKLVAADDSGLEVDFLGGKPGVRSNRFAHPRAKDSENNAKLLRLLKGAPLRKRKARFVCHIAVARNGKLLGNVEGYARGLIRFAPKGRNGFGYDPLFTPQGCKKTFAQMRPSLKNSMSHRAAAAKKAVKIIKTNL